MPAGVYERKKRRLICIDCHKEFSAYAHNAKICPECKGLKKKGNYGICAFCGEEFYRGNCTKQKYCNKHIKVKVKCDICKKEIIIKRCYLPKRGTALCGKKKCLKEFQRQHGRKMLSEKGWCSGPYKMRNGNIIKLKSGYERKMAEYFDSLKLDWQYEAVTFKFSNGMRYTPDFYLKKRDMFIESKGAIFDSFKEKMRLLNKYFPKINLLVVNTNHKNLNWLFGG